jgi:hypothetical protein
LEDFEKWHCPYPSCDKFYKKTSTRSINKHLGECKKRGDAPIPQMSTYLPSSPLSSSSVASPSNSSVTSKDNSNSNVNNNNMVVSHSNSNNNNNSNNSNVVVTVAAQLPSFPLSGVTVAQYSPSDQIGLQNLSLRSASSPSPASTKANSGGSSGIVGGTSSSPSSATSPGGRSKTNLFKMANQQRRATEVMPSIDEVTTNDVVDAATNA